MSAPAPCPGLVPASHPYTLGQRDKTQNPGTDRGTASGTASLKSLADGVLERNKLGQRVGKRVGQSPNSCPTQGTPVGQQNFSGILTNKAFTEKKTSVPLFESGGVGQRDSDGLPDGCPLTGAPFPAGCRFHRRLFARLANEGVLPMPNGGCPLRLVCRLGRPG